VEQTNAWLSVTAQPSPALGDAVNAGHLYVEVKCFGCNTDHELERYTLYKDFHGFKDGRTSAAMRNGLLLQAQTNLPQKYL
jgi:hypothetical protein